VTGTAEYHDNNLKKNLIRLNRFGVFLFLWGENVVERSEGSESECSVISFNI